MIALDVGERDTGIKFVLVELDGDEAVDARFELGDLVEQRGLRLLLGPHLPSLMPSVQPQPMVATPAGHR